MVQIFRMLWLLFLTREDYNLGCKLMYINRNERNDDRLTMVYEEYFYDAESISLLDCEMKLLNVMNCNVSIRDIVYVVYDNNETLFKYMNKMYRLVNRIDGFLMGEL